MEQLLAPAKSDFLLEAPFEVLHEESVEWLDEIKFWKDECAFFYALIIGKTKESPLLKTKPAKEVERHLIYISVERLDDIRMEVESHEKFLSRIIDSKRIDEQLYRKRHKAISGKFRAFEKEYKEMKKKIFALAKKKGK